MLEEFGMQDLKPACTPMEAGYLKISEEKKLTNNSLYHKAIGKLLSCNGIQARCHGSNWNTL